MAQIQRGGIQGKSPIFSLVSDGQDFAHSSMEGKLELGTEFVEGNKLLSLVGEILLDEFMKLPPVLSLTDTDRMMEKMSSKDDRETNYTDDFTDN